MSRKRFAHLMMELSRRICKKYDVSEINNIGEILKHYRVRDFCIDFNNPSNEVGGSYKEIWNSPAMVNLRKSVGMVQA